jgi:hypothetical protein
MGLMIEDGTGKGFLASVNSNNKLNVAAVVSSQEHYTNHKQGRAYSINFSATPTSGSCFFYMKNNSTAYDLSIEGIWLYMEADDYFEIKLGDAGTPVGGSSVTPVNLNTSSGYLPEGTFLNGGDITGLSGGSVAYKLRHANCSCSVYWNFEQDIILGQNGIFTIYSGLTGSYMEGMLDFNYHDSNT